MLSNSYIPEDVMQNSIGAVMGMRRRFIPGCVHLHYNWQECIGMQQARKSAYELICWTKVI